MVTLVRPGGEPITDYQGTVKIKYDGVEKQLHSLRTLQIH